MLELLDELELEEEELLLEELELEEVSTLPPLLPPPPPPQAASPRKTVEIKTRKNDFILESLTGLIIIGIGAKNRFIVHILIMFFEVYCPVAALTRITQNLSHCVKARLVFFRHAGVMQVKRLYIFKNCFSHTSPHVGFIVCGYRIPGRPGPTGFI